MDVHEFRDSVVCELDSLDDFIYYFPSLFSNSEYDSDILSRYRNAEYVIIHKIPVNVIFEVRDKVNSSRISNFDISSYRYISICDNISSDFNSFSLLPRHDFPP